MSDTRKYHLLLTQHQYDRLIKALECDMCYFADESCRTRRYNADYSAETQEKASQLQDVINQLQQQKDSSCQH